MNMLVLLATLLVIPVSTTAQTANDTLAQRLQRLEDSGAVWWPQLAERRIGVRSVTMQERIRADAATASADRSHT